MFRSNHCLLLVLFTLSYIKSKVILHCHLIIKNLSLSHKNIIMCWRKIMRMFINVCVSACTQRTDFLWQLSVEREKSGYIPTPPLGCVPVPPQLPHLENIVTEGVGGNKVGRVCECLFVFVCVCVKRWTLRIVKSPDAHTHTHTYAHIYAYAH